jgi:carbon-monoxide dehydrogenase medium subunit
VLGVSDHAMRLTAVEKLLIGSRIVPGLIAEAGRIARSMVDPHEDIHASKAYRKALVGTLVERAFNSALGQSDGAHAQ